MEMAPPTAVSGFAKELDQFKVSMWGNKDSMVRSSYETLCMASLKFTAKGTREICCMSFESAGRVVEAIYNKMEKP
eukprot:1782163-Alexandrium_andersonii.AAC.1